MNRFVENYRAWRRYRRTLDELNQLSTRELNDLGISPYDVRSIARRSAGL